MSSEDKVYDAVVTLLKALGAEAARGIVYWGVGSAMQNFLVPAVRKLLMGQSLSPAEIEVLRQQLLQQTQMMQQQATSTEQLARLVAEQLKPMLTQQAAAQQYPQPQQSYQPPQYSPVQPPQYSPVAPIQRDDFRRRELEKDLEHLKSLYRDLERQYYMELDPQKREALAQRMKEVRERISEIEARLVAPW
ncbi:MAG: hypothetical protein GU356_11300 [Pyrobaculum sp.]|jgi:uncharacterized membrane protein|nr:hypothetical protein [Pyrobaculum sp.]